MCCCFFSLYFVWNNCIACKVSCKVLVVHCSTPLNLLGSSSCQIIWMWQNIWKFSNFSSSLVPLNGLTVIAGLCESFFSLKILLESEIFYFVMLCMVDYEVLYDWCLSRSCSLAELADHRWSTLKPVRPEFYLDKDRPSFAFLASLVTPRWVQFFVLQIFCRRTRSPSIVQCFIRGCCFRCIKVNLVICIKWF